MKMKSAFIMFAASFAFSLVGELHAQDTAKKSVEKPKVSPEEVEAKFVSTLTAAALSGRSCGIKDQKLGADREDSYNITSVTKQSGDNWLINAHVKYGQNNYDIPIPAQVKWAGDTAVLIFDNISIGGPGTYSARITIYNNTYSGAWSAGDHGGMVYGVITH